MPKIALVGHSHLIALLDAIAIWRPYAGLDETVREGYSESFRGWYTEGVGNAFGFDAKPGFEQFAGAKVVLFSALTRPWVLATLRTTESGEQIALSEPLQRCVAEIADCDIIVSVLYGSQAMEVSLLDQYPDYDFAPFEVPGTRRPIDYQYIETALRLMAMMSVLPLRVFRHAAPGARIVHVAPPPPVEDPARNMHHAETIAERIARHGFGRPGLRMKWHTGYVGMLRRLLWQYGVQVVEPPHSALSDRGFLQEDYVESVLHANEAYGRLVATHVGRLLFG